MKKLLFMAFILGFAGVANSQIVKQTTDTNYANTTVVFVKENTSGTEVLNAVNDDFGMGDMVRVEIAKPAPTPLPVATPVAKPATTPVATTLAKPIAVAAPSKPKAAPVATPKPPAVAKVDTPKATVSPVQNVAKPRQQQQNEVTVPKAAVAKEIRPVVQEKTVETPQVQKTVRTVKAKSTTTKTKKSVKKKKCTSRPPFQAPFFRKKPGKQQYGCPKF